ncbi:MAG: thiamine phosphate synthase [Bacteroidales bacterium]
MKLIVITYPEYLPDEGRLLTSLLECGLAYLHLRKPESTIAEMATLLNSIPAQWHSRIILHDHYELANEYQLAGIHYNVRNKEKSEGLTFFSCSCHSFNEVSAFRDRVKGYVFLSPVFNSISKKNYSGAFSAKELQNASASGIIDEKVIALGGIDESRLTTVSGLRFGGVAVLGTLWHPYLSDPDIEKFKAHFLRLKQQTDSY